MENLEEIDFFKNPVVDKQREYYVREAQRRNLYNIDEQLIQYVIVKSKLPFKSDTASVKVIDSCHKLIILGTGKEKTAFLISNTLVIMQITGKNFEKTARQYCEQYNEQRNVDSMRRKVLPG